MNKRILVTGGCGFIGSHFIEQFLKQNPTSTVINVDSLSYAGNIDNTSSFEKNSRYHFIHEDIRDGTAMQKIFGLYNVGTVIHFAAQSHVDNSINDNSSFLTTNIQGTVNLLQAAKDRFDVDQFDMFYYVSTDEVYGSVDLLSKNKWKETAALNPRNPYSASKASAEHFVNAYYTTFNLPVIISRCSNNFGTRQHEEKLIPVVIKSLVQKKPIPIYGDGKNIREWISVKEHCDAVMFLLENGKVGETYNIGTNRGISNIDLIKGIIDLYSVLSNTKYEENLKLISFVEDRKGHDKKYSIDFSKLSDIGWVGNKGSGFVCDLEETVDYYMKKFN